MKKILFAENDLVLADLISKKLASEGLDVFNAFDGRQALQKLKEEIPDLFLIDIDIPILNGLEILSEKNNDQITAKIPTIMIIDAGKTSFSEDKAIKLKINYFLDKNNIDLEILSEKIKYILQNRGKAGKVLIIEDEAILEALLAKKMEKSGFEVYQADSGETGVRIAKKINPDIVLLDLMLPGKDGFSVINDIKEVCIPAPPILIISNLSEKSDIDKALSMGAAGYFVKANVDLRDLTEKVTSFIRR